LCGRRFSKRRLTIWQGNECSQAFFTHSVVGRIPTEVWPESFLMKEAGGFHAVDPEQVARGGQVIGVFSLM